MQTQLQKQQNFQAELEASVYQQQELQMVRFHGGWGATAQPPVPGFE